LPVPPVARFADSRLRKHADFQRVYKSSRRQSSREMAWFAAPQPPEANVAAARIGLTVPKAIGNAVLRNRIKRRMRAAIRRHLQTLTAPVDVVLHPRRSVAQSDFAQIERDIAAIFTRIQRESGNTLSS
jgi:ribonuclease P protein component